MKPVRITVRRDDNPVGEAARIVAVLVEQGWVIVEETTDGWLGPDGFPAKTILEWVTE